MYLYFDSPKNRREKVGQKRYLERIGHEFPQTENRYSLTNPELESPSRRNMKIITPKLIKVILLIPRVKEEVFQTAGGGKGWDCM